MRNEKKNGNADDDNNEMRSSKEEEKKRQRQNDIKVHPKARRIVKYYTIRTFPMHCKYIKLEEQSIHCSGASHITGSFQL